MRDSTTPNYAPSLKKKKLIQLIRRHILIRFMGKGAESRLTAKRDSQGDVLHLGHLGVWAEQLASFSSGCK